MTLAASNLALRDVHVPVEPGFWPPAPGWWLVAGAIVVMLSWLAWLMLRRRRRRLVWHEAFVEETAQETPAEQIAAMSSLLRRAARRIDPQADRLAGEAWLIWLDGDKSTLFSQGPGRLLLHGGFMASVEPQAVAELLPVARARFLQLMEKRK